MTERDPNWSSSDAAFIRSSSAWLQPQASLSFSLNFLLTIAERSALSVLDGYAGANSGFVTAQLTAGNLYYFWLDAPAFSPSLSIYDSSGYRLLGLDGDDLGIADAFNVDSIYFFAPETSGTYYLRFGFTSTIGAEQFAIEAWEDAGANLYNDYAAGVSTVSIAATGAIRPEGASGATPFTFTVTRTGSLDYLQSIGWLVLAQGDAPAGDDDFVDPAALVGELTFAAGEVSKTVTIQVAGDTLAEGDERFTVQLFAPSRGLKIGVAEAEGVILDDDGGANGVISVTRTAASVQEGTGEGALVSFTVSRDAAYAAAHSVRWQIEGIGSVQASAADFAGGVLPSGIITFAPGELTRTVQIRLAGDSLLEPTEGFQLRLFDPSAGARLGTPTAAMQIIDDDSRVSVTALTPMVVEGSGTAVFLRFRVSREDAAATQTVDWAIHGTGSDPASGADFAGGLLPSGRIAFAVGELSRTISVQLTTDSALEADETLEMRLTAPFGGVGFVNDRAAAAIVNDDAEVVFAGPPLSLLEGDSGTTGLVVTLQRSGFLDVAVDIPWAVTSTGAIATRADAADFADGVLPSGIASFAAGATTASFVIPVAGDMLAEPNEQFGVTLTRPQGITMPQRTAVVQLLDDEAWISLDPTGVTVTEGETAVFTLRRSLPLDVTQSVSWSVVGSGAAAASAVDFAGGALPSGTVTFAPGETAREIHIAAAHDMLPEAEEGFRLVLGGATPGVLLRGTEAAGTILDGVEPAWLSIAADQATVMEGNAGFAEITFTVTRSGDLAAAGSVAWSFFQEQDVTTGQWPWEWTADFDGGVLPSGLLQFTAAEAAKTITIRIAGDQVVERHEIFGIELSAPDQGFALQQGRALATILNDDTALSAPEFGSLTPLREVTEGDDGAVTLRSTLYRAGYLELEHSVAWRVRTDPGPEGVTAEDFLGGVAPSGIVTFAPGVASAEIAIHLAGDTRLEETDEYVAIDLELPPGLSGSSAFMVAKVLDDDSGFRIGGMHYVQREGTGGTTTHIFGVPRVGDLAVPVAVEWRAIALGGPGTASPDDFAGGVMPSGILTYAAGEATRFISLDVAADALAEGSETYGLQLFNPPPDYWVSPTPAIAKVTDDDASVSVGTTDRWVTEGDSGYTTVPFTVSRSGDLSVTHLVKWSVAPAGATPADADDFWGRVLPTGTLTFRAGEKTKTIEVKLRGEQAYEPNEGFLLTLSDPSPSLTIGQAAAGATIVNDDAAAFATITHAVRNEGHGSGAIFTFNILRRGNTEEAQGVDWTIAPAGDVRVGLADFPDGVLPSGRVEFAPGETRQAVTVRVLGDRVVEGDESFLLRLLNPSAGLAIGQSTAMATIRNDDALVTATADTPALAEGTGNTTAFSFTLTRSGDLSVTHEVTWTAAGTGTARAATNDFAGGTLPSGRIAFAPGETTHQVLVEIAADSRAEADESFVLRLTKPSAGLSLSFGGAVATILDDDGPAASTAPAGSDWLA